MFKQLGIMGHWTEIFLSYFFKLLYRRKMKHHLLWHENVELERINILEESLKEKLLRIIARNCVCVCLSLLLTGRKIKPVLNWCKRIYNTCLRCPFSLSFDMTIFPFWLNNLLHQLLNIHKKMLISFFHFFNSYFCFSHWYLCILYFNKE